MIYYIKVFEIRLKILHFAFLANDLICYRKGCRDDIRYFCCDTFEKSVSTNQKQI